MDDNLAYFLLKPDCILLDKTKALAEILYDRDFVIHAFKCSSLPSKLYDVMYYSGFRSELDYWLHNKKAYKFGPVTGVVCSWSKSQAQKKLKALQGAAVPELEIEESFSLRKLLKASNRCFNVLHVPDSTEIAEQELSILFGLHNPDFKLLTSFHLTPEQLSKALAYHQYGSLHNYSGIQFLKALRFRVLHIAKWEYLKETSDVKNLPSFLCNVSEAEQSFFLRDCLSYSNNPYLETLTSILSNLEVRGTRIGIGNYEMLIGVLESLGVFISEFEKYLIETYFRYPTKT